MTELIASSSRGRGARGGSDIRVHPIPDADTGCHNWPGAKNQDGYGLLGRSGRSMSAHRWYWIQANGEIPAGMKIDHLCRNPACCNVDHMEVVTNRENVMRGRSPHVLLSLANRCKQGHELTAENSKPKIGGGRQCRTCYNRLARECYHRTKRTAA